MANGDGNGDARRLSSRDGIADASSLRSSTEAATRDGNNEALVFRSGRNHRESRRAPKCRMPVTTKSDRVPVSSPFCHSSAPGSEHVEIALDLRSHELAALRQERVVIVGERPEDSVRNAVLGEVRLEVGHARDAAVFLGAAVALVLHFVEVDGRRLVANRDVDLRLGDPGRP